MVVAVAFVVLRAMHPQRRLAARLTRGRVEERAVEAFEGVGGWVLWRTWREGVLFQAFLPAATRAAFRAACTRALRQIDFTPPILRIHPRFLRREGEPLEGEEPAETELEVSTDGEDEVLPVISRFPGGAGRGSVAAQRPVGGRHAACYRAFGQEPLEGEEGGGGAGEADGEAHGEGDGAVRGRGQEAER